MSNDIFPKIISFDMNGTLTRDKFVELVWHYGVPTAYSIARDIPFEQAKEYVFQEYCKVGEDRVEWYDIKYWYNLFGLGDGWMELLKSFEHEAGPFPEVVPVLEDLSEKYSLIVTTNASYEFVDIELGAGGLKGYFQQIFSCTSDFGEVKKSPEFYTKVCNALQLSPEEIIHVGDHRQFDFVAPNELGIRAFYLDRSGNEQGDYIVKDLLEFRDKLRYL